MREINSFRSFVVFCANIFFCAVANNQIGVLQILTTAVCQMLKGEGWADEASFFIFTEPFIFHIWD